MGRGNKQVFKKNACLYIVELSLVCCSLQASQWEAHGVHRRRTTRH
jgi:hypothetical protein